MTPEGVKALLRIERGLHDLKDELHRLDQRPLYFMANDLMRQLGETRSIEVLAVAAAIRPLLDRAGLCMRLAVSLDWWTKHRSGLAAAGFPQPCIGSGSGARWDPAAIDRWIAARSAEDEPPIELDPDSAELERRCLVLAGA